MGRATRAIDCQGGTLVPGFHDAHCHILAAAASLLAVDCSPAAVSSIEDIKERIRERAADAPPDGWIRGVGYNEFYLSEKRHPTRWDLDAAVPDRPVRLTHRSGHAVALNSRAMALAAIGSDTPDPPNGVIERDGVTGEPTGLLLEMDRLPGGRDSAAVHARGPRRRQTVQRAVPCPGDNIAPGRHAWKLRGAVEAVRGDQGAWISHSVADPHGRSGSPAGFSTGRVRLRT